MDKVKSKLVTMTIHYTTDNDEDEVALEFDHEIDREIAREVIRGFELHNYIEVEEPNEDWEPNEDE